MKGILKTKVIGFGMILALSLSLVWGQWIVDGRRFPEDPNAPGPGRTFPVLVLELGGVWTDFELKASTDNFESLVYYIRSSDMVIEAGDPDVWIYFTDDISLNPRKWRRAEIGVPILDQLVNPANSEVAFVVVCPSHETAVDWTTWMFEGNSKLVWSYVRYDGADLEMNNVNSNAKWRSVVPVQWRSERISP
jgi:hypothetical protein